MSVKAGKAMVRSWNLRLVMGLGVALVAALMATSGSRAEALDPILKNTVPPPLSFRTAQYFKSHPSEWAKFVSRLPLLPTEDSSATARDSVAPSFHGNTWQAVTRAPTGGLCNPLLLTDATVIVHRCYSPFWYRLTPGVKGNYVDGKWSQIASLPVMGGTQYGPQYHASAVLPDGRVIIMGGEYNVGQGAVWTNLGAIYDPVANEWTAVSPPTGNSWNQIGDAQGVVLADGTFMLASCCAFPAADAVLNAKTLTWTATAAPNAGGAYQDEQGYDLLPNGNVLTVDIWTNYPNGNATNAEQYSPLTATWMSAGHTPVSLPDPIRCGTFEMGPGVLRGDGTVVEFGGNTGCNAFATSDPTAIYDSRAGMWSSGPNLPPMCGSNGATSCDLADAPAALLPNGDILLAASAGFGQRPTHFFELSSRNVIARVADTELHAATSGAYYYNFLVLPNGQVLATDFSDTAEVFTMVGGPVASWAPVISSAPSRVVAGGSYKITGTQLAGRSQGAYYGDDAQAATNYPIVKIVNSATGDVFYARTFNFSRMSVARNSHDNSADFTAPSTIEAGPSSLFVIANGIASTPVSVTVQ